MKHRGFCTWVLSALLALGGALGPAAPALAQVSAASAEEATRAYVEGELVVVLCEGSTSEDVARLCQVPGVAGLQRTMALGGDGVGAAVLRLADGVDVDAVCAALAADACVEVAQPNYLYTAAPLPDEGLSSSELGGGVAGRLTGTLSTQATGDPYRDDQPYLDSIAAPKAWELTGDLSTLTKRPAVAVIDQGFDVHHPDLQANVLAYWDVAENDADVSDDGKLGEAGYGHGSHVCGLVSAVSNNGVGIAGASNGAGLVCLKVFDRYGGASSSKLIDCYDWLLAEDGGMTRAARYNVRVANVSLGASVEHLDKEDKAFFDVADRARDAGIVTVCAAGNAGSCPKGVPAPFYPGDYEGCVSVISLDDADQRLSSSNYNASDAHEKDICAPGSSLFSAYPMDAAVTPTGYHRLSGTSMAAPLVSAVLAMEFAVNPQLTADEAMRLLYASTTDLGAAGWDRETGWGKVNALAAVKAAKESPAPEPTPTPTPVTTGWRHNADGTWSWIDESGKAAVGWRAIGGIWYWFDVQGIMATGWRAIGGVWYWFESSGAMATGWRAIRGTWYLFASSGAMLTGWQAQGSTWYYLDENGAMRTGWLAWGGSWYWLESSGAMATGWRSINGKWYWFAADGHWAA